MFDGILATFFEYLIAFVELCGAFVIATGVIRALVSFVRCCLTNRRGPEVSELRLQLGQNMVVALEFQVAADILQTGISPTWQDILLLAATIALRTILNALLERELERLNRVCGPIDLDSPIGDMSERFS